MAYQTIRDLMAQVRSLHRRLQDAVREAQARANDERSAMLLDLIDEHEATIEKAVEAAEQRGSDGVLDTWLQFEPNTELERAMKHSGSVSAPSGDEVVAHVLETENAIMRLYELLQGSSGSASVQSFFASLLELQDSAVRRQARARLEAADF